MVDAIEYALHYTSFLLNCAVTTDKISQKSGKLLLFLALSKLTKRLNCFESQTFVRTFSGYCKLEFETFRL